MYSMYYTCTGTLYTPVHTGTVHVDAGGKTVAQGNFGPLCMNSVK